MIRQPCNKIALCVILLGLVTLHGRMAWGLTVGLPTVISPANPAQVPQYGKIELDIPLATASTKYYEASPAQGGVDLSAVFTAPDGTTRTINGFYNGSAWRIRFAPAQTGQWQAVVNAVDSSGSASAAAVNFSCVASGNAGFAQISGKYIQFTNGTAFYGVGHNTGWQQDVEQPTAADMAAQGENLLSFWLAAPWALPSDSWWMRRTPLENSVGGLGYYDQTASAYIDAVVANAETAGIYLLPSIWAHDQLCDGTVPSGWPASWNNNAYNTICTATNFYQTTSAGADTNQWRLQKNYYRYILARWGYSRAIAGWVGVVEIDGTTGYVANSVQATNWCTALRTYFASNDKYRLNTTALYPLLITRVDAPGFDAGMNMRGTDSYSSKNSNVSVAATMAGEASTMRASGKPGLFTEFGGDTLSGASQPAHLHNGIWAGTAAGTAMTPLLWCDGGNYPMLTPDMRSHLQILGQFIAGLDYTGNNALAAASPAVPAGFKAWSQQLNNRGFAWIQNTAGSTLGGQTLTVSGLTPGQYSVAWYDVWSSGSAAFATTPSVIVSGSTLSTALPALARPDIACRFFANAGTPAISALSASPSTVNATTTLLAVTASDDGGEAALTYTWSTVGNLPGPVTCSVNGTNAAKSSLVTFTAAGNYTFLVTVKDLGGLVATQTVSVIVNAVPTQGLQINPPSAIVGVNGSQLFAATALDQFGHAVPMQSAWSVSGGGSIAASGLFLAGSSEGGPFTVTAASSGFSGTASVGVVDSPPSVNMTSPIDGARLATGSTVQLAANAKDDGAVASVAFYGNGQLLGLVTSAPYTFAWVNAPAGSYALTALAVDNAGHSTLSAAVNVVLESLPVVSLTAPLNNAVLPSAGSVVLSAAASDADGTVAKVEFYSGTILIGTSTTAPYAAVWNNPAAGTYTLTAKATDDLGGVSVSPPVAVTVNAAPSVSMTSPSNNAVYLAGTNVTLSASAADSDGSVSKVEFYAGSALIGAVTVAPYSLVWNSPARGTYALIAKATDNLGAATVSAPVTLIINAPPTCSITSPANNATINHGSTLTISAAAADSDGTVASVKFIDNNATINTSSTAPYRYAFVPARGTHVLKVIATDNLGAATTSSTVTITVK